LVVFENKFPALERWPADPVVSGTKLTPVEKSQGVCEVVLFTSDHDGIMSKKPLSRFMKLIKVWKDRYQTLGSREEIEYVYIFENKGEEVGVTLSHPHGQIYGYPFIPPILKKELNNSREYFKRQGNCLFCDILKQEKVDQERIVVENDSFTALIPFFARYAYEINIYANDHLSSFTEFGEKEIEDLAAILKTVIKKYDNLFGFVFPYIMGIHQEPSIEGTEDYSHFHIEFYPPHRTKDKLKYLAGSEAGAGTFINGTHPEEKAEELRNTEPKNICKE
ncbi:MAG: galactose-1-phosphate uridylyltransferase, partial [Halanaerobiales bacterium]